MKLRRPRTLLGMVLMGMAVALWSALRFTQVTRQIEGGTYRPNLVAMWLLSLAILAIGATGALWLLLK